MSKDRQTWYKVVEECERDIEDLPEQKGYDKDPDKIFDDVQDKLVDIVKGRAEVTSLTMEDIKVLITLAQY